MESLTKHIDKEAHAEQKILELREEAKKQQKWFDDHWASITEVAKQVFGLITTHADSTDGRQARGHADDSTRNSWLRGTHRGMRPR